MEITSMIVAFSLRVNADCVLVQMSDCSCGDISGFVVTVMDDFTIANRKEGMHESLQYANRADMKLESSSILIPIQSHWHSPAPSPLNCRTIASSGARKTRPRDKKTDDYW
jgi:hypothetical protein